MGEPGKPGKTTGRKAGKDQSMEQFAYFAVYLYTRKQNAPRVGYFDNLTDALRVASKHAGKNTREYRAQVRRVDNVTSAPVWNNLSGFSDNGQDAAELNRQFPEFARPR